MVPILGRPGGTPPLRFALNTRRSLYLSKTYESFPGLAHNVYIPWAYRTLPEWERRTGKDETPRLKGRQDDARTGRDRCKTGKPQCQPAAGGDGGGDADGLGGSGRIARRSGPRCAEHGDRIEPLLRSSGGAGSARSAVFTLRPGTAAGGLCQPPLGGETGGAR